ncbi:unnamed protein product, partial [Trichogramma brassicae]
HTLVPLHPLPGPAHRRQAEVRPPPPNSQRKGSRCDRCPCEDHAQLWRAQKQPTQAVCSRRRLHTPVRSPRLEHSSTNASLHTTGGVSPPTSLPACDDRRPAACRLRGHICPCRHTTAGPSRGRASAALRPPPRGRKGRGTLGNAKQVARSMGPVEEGPMDAPTDPKYQRVWIERRHGELNYHLTQLLTGHGFFKHHSRRYDYNQKALNARSAPHPSRMRSTCVLSLPEVQRRKRERLHSLLYEVMTRKAPPGSCSRVCRRAWVRSPLGEFSRFVFSPGVVEPVPEVERVPLKKKTRAMSSASEAVKTPITVRAGSDRITISRSPRRGLTRLAIDGAQHSQDEVRSENHTHKRAPDAGATAQLERMMAPEARTTLTR